MQVDTWRAAYRGIVPDSHLEGLSCAESEERWLNATGADEGCVFVAENERGVFGFAAGGAGRVLHGA